MKRKILFWIAFALFSLLAAGCSTGNTSSGVQGGSVKPPPGVRVEALPTTASTVAPQPSEAVAAATIEPTAVPQLYYDPTPDENALEDQINAMMDDIDRKLRSQNIQLKP